MNEQKSSPALILAAWVVVSVPLGWGVYKTAVNAMKLFQTAPSAVAPSTPGPAPTAATK